MWAFYKHEEKYSKKFNMLLVPFDASSGTNYLFADIPKSY